MQSKHSKEALSRGEQATGTPAVTTCLRPESRLEGVWGEQAGGVHIMVCVSPDSVTDTTDHGTDKVEKLRHGSSRLT